MLKNFYCLIFLCLCCSFSITAAIATEKILQPIGIQATTHLGDHQSFRKNDTVSFLLSLERDAYITAIYIDADNNLYQVIPNAIHNDNYYKANLFIPVPPQNAAYKFKISPPYGDETLWIFASDTNVVQLQGIDLDNGMVKLTQTLEQIRDSLKKNSSQRFDETSVHITTSHE